MWTKNYNYWINIDKILAVRVVICFFLYLRTSETDPICHFLSSLNQYHFFKFIYDLTTVFTKNVIMWYVLLIDLEDHGKHSAIIAQYLQSCRLMAWRIISIFTIFTVYFICKMSILMFFAGWLISLIFVVPLKHCLEKMRKNSMSLIGPWTITKENKPYIINICGGILITIDN